MQEHDTPTLDRDATKRIAEFLRHPVAEPPVSEDVPQLAQYEVYEPLGAGASGAVYMAIPKAQPESVVAIKIFRTDCGGSPSPRVLRELDLLRALELPCVPRIIDFGVDQGRFFITTEVVRGMNVDRYCESLDREQRVHLLAEIAAAVQQLHELGVIHRDLKPSNIMITQDGRPMLIDLGIATLMEDSGGDTLTAEGTPIGSLGFMPPEQARGEKSAITIRSDVYSLGATACFLLTGKTPHEAQGPLHKVLQRVAHDPPRHPMQLDATMPKPLAAILAKATGHDPQHRTASAKEFAEQLSTWLSGEPVSIANPSLAHRIAFRVRRNPLLTASGALTLVAFVAAVFFGFAAAAEARVANEYAVIAHEQSELAESRQLLAVERDEFAAEVTRTNRRLSAIVANFVSKAEDHAGSGEFGEALAPLYAIDHLLEPGNMIDPALAQPHSRARVDIVIDALHQVYRTNEFGGGEMIESLRATLSDLEGSRGTPRLENP